MVDLYWGIANKNPYIMLQCKGYVERHGKVFWRKWWYLVKALYKNINHCLGYILNKEEVIRLVDFHEVISFDIFDTLLVRPFEKPSDLFFELEKREGCGGFGNERIKAERKARERYREQEDVTFDQIYQQIGVQYRHLKEKELELENEVLTANGSVYEIYQYALGKGKKIIVCSDMYLPKKFLETVLYANGYQGFEKIYVSSDIMMTKGSGNLFGRALHELHVSNTSVLHIGDNLESDGKANMIYGMTYICAKGSQFVKIERKKDGRCFCNSPRL